MPITSYPAARALGYPGQPEGPGDNVSLVNEDPRTTQSSTLTVDTVTNSAVYTASIDGIEVSYTADGSAVNTEIVAGLKAAIEAEPLINGRVTATATSATVLTVAARIAGYAFTLATSDAKLTAATPTANDLPDAIPFGEAVLFDGSGKAKRCTSANLTAKSVVVAPTAENSTVYAVTISVPQANDGRGYAERIAITSDSDATVKEIVDALQAAIDAANVATFITATDDDTALTLTAAIVGFDFSITLEGPWGAQTWAGETIDDVLAGVALRDLTQSQENGGYAGGATLSVRRRGRVNVTTGDSCAPGDPVYVRVAGTGAPFRSTLSGSNYLPTSRARWAETLSSTLAALECDF